MGMFDYLSCEVPLPDGATSADKPPFEWQTKDLICYLEKYRISKDGRLMQDKRTGSEDLCFHGDLFFHGCTKPDHKGFKEFRARFTHGQLESITLQYDMDKESFK